MSKRKKRGLGVDVVEEIVRDYGHLARTWANEHHVAFRIANSGQHWIFTLDTHTVEWWPSTGRCVVDYRTGSPIVVLSYQALLDVLDRSFTWPARRQAQPAGQPAATPEPRFPNPLWKDKALASEHMHLAYYDRPLLRCGQSTGKTQSCLSDDPREQRLCYCMILKIWTNPQQVWVAQHLPGPARSRFVSVLSDRGGGLMQLEAQFAEVNLNIIKMSDRDHVLYRIFTFFCHTGLLPIFAIPTTEGGVTELKAEVPSGG